MKLYLIRHLPTSWNVQGILQGSNDIPILPISEEMKKEVEENLKIIQGLSFDKKLISEYQRTHQTADIYGMTGCKVEPLLNELNFGKYEKQKKSLMVEELGEEWMNRPRSLTLGESIIDFEKRLLDFIENYKDSKMVLSFSHGRVIRALKSIHKIGDVEGMNHFEIRNNELVILDF